MTRLATKIASGKRNKVRREAASKGQAEAEAEAEAEGGQEKSELFKALNK